MNAAVAADLLKTLILEAVTLATPILVTAMAIGLAISLFQSVTSIQEQTLSFVPKLLACCLCLWIMAPWMLQQLGSLLELMLAKAGTFTP